MRKNRGFKVVARILLVACFYELVAPLGAYALTGGPIQPEFSEFSSVTASNMVNEFTGDFTYGLPVLNIPGPNGGGYALSLSYHSGKSGEEDASWVGKGWSLNPGAIIRQKRGFPDDYDNVSVKYWNKTEPNWTASIGKRIGVEGFSIDLDNVASRIGGVSGSIHTRFNNYTGYSHTWGIGLDVKGWVDLGYSVTNGEGSWSFSVNPAKILMDLSSKANKNEQEEICPDDPEAQQKQKAADEKERQNLRTWAYAGMAIGGNLNNAANYAIASFGEVVRPTNFPRYTGIALNFNVGVEGNPFPIPIGLEGGFSAGWSLQKNQETENLQAFGYMYSGNAGPGSMMDYYVEKEASYNKRDRYMGVPFSNADNFIVSGEGIGGGFRLYNKQVGQFHPPAKSSSFTTIEYGAEIQLGADIGGGVDISAGRHSLDIKEWNDSDPSHPYKFAKPGEGDEPYFFRFYGDLGGNVEFANNDAAVRAGIAVSDPKPILAQTGVATAMNDGKRGGRSSYIGYNTIEEMKKRSAFLCWGMEGPSYVQSYNKSDTVRRFVDRDDPAIAKTVGEFAVVNPNGIRYVYGLPVYSRNERDLFFGIDGASVPDGYLAYKSVTTSSAKYVVGEERNSPYATTYLLTEITTPDYVDRTHDGPSADDLGGYTKFTYTRTAGTDSKSGGAASSWYKWRAPYRGLLYNRNSLSDSKDDLGAVAYGEKEIYYLESIETKTHVARFITSSRKDGYEAVTDEATASGSPSATTATPGTNKLRKLDRIELYAKKNDGQKEKLLTTVHFKYTYTLCKNRPNSETDGEEGTVGNLTLERVYFEYEGAINARTSPYIFGYTYKRSGDYSALPAGLRAGKYKNAIEFADDLVADAENPNYSSFDVDAWGNYRHNGIARSKLHNPWVDQNPDLEQFDPAAWQLKSIQLPSGGEIHIQYEQKDYRYVQNRDAMAMVNMKPGSGEIDVVDGGVTTIYPDLAKLGVTTVAGIDSLKKVLYERFVNQKERLYFKFLYSLDISIPALSSCGSEYITGYVKVSDVRLVGGGTGIAIDLMSPGDYAHPQDVARNFVATSRAGIIDKNGNCDPSIRPVAPREDNPWDVIYQLLSAFNNKFYDEDDAAKNISLKNSYIKIPLTRAKKGGGIRVKRLLMYDKGIESGAATLYGTEYEYTGVDGKSSGVATNEPGAAREENPIVGYLEKREEQSWANRVISGRDKEEFEGPYGESLLPAPSVGYSRVVTKSLHTGKSTTGYTVSEFYTAYDFPFDMDYSIGGDTSKAADHTDILAKDRLAMIYAIIINYRLHNLYRTQGYRFIITDMHGRPKKVTAYGGPPGSAYMADVSSQTFDYFQPGEKIPMMYGNSIEDTLHQYPGKETEVVFENRSIEDVTTDGSVEVDFSTGLVVIIPIPYVSAFPMADFGEERMRAHVTSKVVRYPVVLRSVTTVRDGITQKTENIAFDPQSGRPILTKVTDGYNGLTFGSSTSGHDGGYYSFTTPASQQYPAMGQLAMRERTLIASGNDVVIEKRYNSRHYLNFRFTASGGAARSLDLLTTGDLVMVIGTGNVYLGTFYIGEISGNQVELVPTYISNTNTSAKVNVASIEVLRSGRTNQLNASAGSITTYGRLPVVVEHKLQ